MGGAFSTTTFTSDNTNGYEVVSVGVANGSYDGMLSARGYVLKVNQQPAAPDAVTRDGNVMTQYASQAEFDAAREGWFFDETGQIAWVKFSTPTCVATSVTLEGKGTAKFRVRKHQPVHAGRKRRG